MKVNQHLGYLFVLALCAALVPVSAWASRSDTQEALIRAETVVAAAERNNAGQHAPMEMKFARDALSDAREQADRRRWDRAQALARRATVDAQLAEAKARLARAERSRSELEAAVNSLRTELERSTD